MLLLCMEITEIIHRMQSNGKGAASELLDRCWGEFHGLARKALRREYAKELETTELVNETWLKKWLGWTRRPQVQNRDQFFGWVYQNMMQVLIDQGRKRRSLKRSQPDGMGVEVQSPELSYRYEVALLKLEAKRPAAAVAFRMQQAGYECHEIAGLMKLPVWKVRLLSREARRILSRSL